MRLFNRLNRSTRANWSRARAAEGGATALEFALVSVPFIFLLISTLELGLIFVANVNLQNAISSVGRQIRVGGIVAPGLSGVSSGANVSLVDLKKRICAALPLTGGQNCTANLQIDVRELTTFNGTMATSPYSGTMLNASNFCYYSGASGSIVEMRAYYLWPVFSPILLAALVNTKALSTTSGTTKGNWFALNSQEVFRNEPGSSSSNGGGGC